MPEKFTIEKHQERMRRILTQAEPVERTGVVESLLERARKRVGATAPRLPRLPRI